MQHISAKHIIKTELQPLLTIRADKERVSQVVTNLISNAIKYSPDAKDIIIRSKSDDHHITVNVQDFGIGIPKKSQGRIFDQFFRVTDLKTSTFPGLGLGLFISAEIVKRHKGKIWVESKESEGSTFSFSLPINEA